MQLIDHRTQRVRQILYKMAYIAAVWWVSFLKKCNQNLNSFLSTHSKLNLYHVDVIKRESHEVYAGLQWSLKWDMILLERVSWNSISSNSSLHELLLDLIVRKAKE